MAEYYYIWLKEDNPKMDFYKTPCDCDQAQKLLCRQREKLKEYCCAKNHSFEQKYGLKPIYSSSYSNCIAAQLTAEQYKKISLDPDVEKVGTYHDTQLCAFETDAISRQVGFDSLTGSHSPSFEASGDFGKGINIGNVSARNMVYMANDAQLAGLEQEGRLVALNDSVDYEPSVHSSTVVSIISGRSVFCGQTEYRGVAPLATLYFAPSSSVAEMLIAVETCLDNGAVIINYSAGEAFPDGNYSEFDRQIDWLIYNANFLFVCAVGNSRYVASPATSCNCLAVGNAQTKYSPDKILLPPYPVFYMSEDNCSAYEQAEGLPNKPDICAPGTYVHYIDSRGNVSFEQYGTSFASPYAAGVAAQAAEKYPEAVLNPLLLKAILLSGADSDFMDTYNNPTVSQFELIRTKSGAGFLSSVNSLDISGLLSGRLTDDPDKMHIAELELKKGDKVRIALCFMKGEYGDNPLSPQNSPTLEIYTPGKTRLMFSNGMCQNVRLLQFEAHCSGIYRAVVCPGQYENDGTVYALAWRKLQNHKATSA